MSAWKIAPEIPSAAPLTSAATTRGSRSSLTMKRAPGSPPPSSTSTTAPGESGNSPVPIASTARAHVTAASASDATTARGRTRSETAPVRTRGHSSAILRRRTTEMKIGTPTKAITIPAWTSPGAREHAAERVGDQHQHRAEDGGVGEHPALVGAGDRAGDVRDRQPDEGDRPGGGRGRARQQRDRDGAGDPRPPRVGAEGARLVVAERERVQGPRQGERRQRADDHERQRHRQLRRAAPVERADRPLVVLLQQQRVGQREAVDERDQRVGDRGPGEREPHRCGAAAAGGADRVDEHRGQRGADEREPHVALGSGDPEQPDRGHHGGRRPGVDAEQAGIGERVARQRLHQRAGQAERHADHEPEQRARQPDLGHDRGVGGVQLPRQRLHDLPQRDAAGADGEAEQDRESERREGGGGNGNTHIRVP